MVIVGEPMHWHYFVSCPWLLSNRGLKYLLITKVVDVNGLKY
jgi:hypothetical protein